MGYAQIKAAVKTCLYIHCNMCTDHVCMIMHTSSTFNIELKDIFLYLYVYSCLYHSIAMSPHHHPWRRPWQQLQHHVATSPTPPPDKKSHKFVFLYHFHFTNNILGAIDSDNVNDGTAPPPQSPHPSPHRRNMFTPTLSPPPPHQRIHHHHHHHHPTSTCHHHHHHHHHPTSTCHQRVPVTRW